MGNVTREPTTNDATAYSSNEVVNAIKNAETIAGRISGNVTRRNVCSGPAPRSAAASSNATSTWSSLGTSTRIVYGTLITMCPITMVSSERGTPSVWKSRSSETPKTTYGITSGLNRSADTALLPRNRRLVSASDASTPSATAPVLDRAATIALVSSAPFKSGFERNSRYHFNVKPESGKLGTADLLNEKKSTTSAKKDRRSRAAFFESATSISARPPGRCGGSGRRQR